MTQANTTPTTTLPASQVIFLPIVWNYSNDRAEGDGMTRDEAIDFVSTGECDAILKIIASDETGRCWDASQEIAREAMYQAIDRYGGDSIPRNCLSFAEDALGLMGTRALTLAAA